MSHIMTCILTWIGRQPDSRTGPSDAETCELNSREMFAKHIALILAKTG